MRLEKEILLHAGAVHACQRDEMPDGADLAALLRY